VSDLFLVLGDLNVGAPQVAPELQDALGDGSPVRLYPEATVLLEQMLPTCISMFGVGMAGWYAVIRIAGW
jgi:hypothetical protein